MSSIDFKSVSELWVTSFVRLCVCYMYITAHPEGSAGDVTLTSVSLQLISVLLLTSAGTRGEGRGDGCYLSSHKHQQLPWAFPMWAEVTAISNFSMANIQIIDKWERQKNLFSTISLYKTDSF